jgi:predicted  nucleic acid-binding Zn-ribbon protein
MRTQPIWLAALLGLALVAPARSLHAQAKPDQAVAVRAAADVQAWFGEMEQLQTQLREIQLQALEDPQLNAAQTELGAKIRDAMQKADPALAKGLTRMDAMEAEAGAAQQKGDAARLQQLAAEAQQIQRQFVAVQERVLQQPDIAAQLASFQQKLERKMAELNPASEKLVARFRELETKLEAEGHEGR